MPLCSVGFRATCRTVGGERVKPVCNSSAPRGSRLVSEAGQCQCERVVGTRDEGQAPHPKGVASQLPPGPPG